jgi:uncharacterized membrane protein
MDKKKYLRAVNSALNLPKEIRQRVMADFESDLEFRLEAGMTWEEILCELGKPKKAAADLNEQMKEYAYRKSPFRFLFAALAILSGGWLVLYTILHQFGLLLNTLQWNFSPSEAASIGIIGGTDGPTAIFVTSAVSAGPDWDVILMCILTLLCVLAYVRLCRCKPKA